MALKKVRLELASGNQYLEGSASHGYEFTAPLTDDGHLDKDEWPSVRKQCTVRRFWRDEDDQNGELHHTRHRTWAFSYMPGEEDDEHFFSLDTHRLVVGEYVSVKETGGQTLTFKIVGIT